jgi:hypothetical protein
MVLLTTTMKAGFTWKTERDLICHYGVMTGGDGGGSGWVAFFLLCSDNINCTSK